jgi:tetratricopeptide (TPR) repeat protein
VRLDPLTDDESAVLLGHLLGQGPLPGSARAAINRVAEGNPLFVEELISVLIEEGLLRREGGRWKATVDLTTIDIPPSINLVLAARLDHLGAEGRILQRASVEGKLFDRPAVVAISPAAERPVVAESLLTLARRDLIRPEPSGLVTPHGFQFRHMLLRDAAYASLPKRERAELHELFAAWLNGEAAARAVEYEELVGQHLEAAYRYRFALGPVNAKSRELARQAARQLTVAGRRALAREDMPAASNLLARAAELTGHGEASARLLHELGTAFIGVGKLAEADVVLREAREAAVAAGDAHLEAHVLVTRLRLDLEVEPASVAVADREVGRVIRTFEAMGDEGGLARAWRLLASAHWHRAQAADSEAALAQAAIHAQAAADTDEEVTILGDLTGVALLGPTPVDDGIRRCEEALAKSKGHPSQEGRALRALGGMRGMLGDFEEARRLLGRSIEILDDLGLALWLGGALQVLGEVEMMADDPLAAEGAFRRSYDLFVRGGNRSYMATAAALLATALCALGRDEEAEELTGVSEAAAAADDVDTQMLWRAARAKVFAARGRLDEALRLGWAAVHVGRRTDFHASAGLLLDLAQILVAAGRRHEAVEVVGEALDMCQRKGNLVWAARAGGVLADLTG